MNQQSAMRIRSVLQRVTQMHKSLHKRKQKYSRGGLSFSISQLHARAMQALEIGLCPYCMDSLTIYNFSPDHYSALCQGGSHDMDNIEFVCLACNMTKSSMGARCYETSKMWEYSEVYKHYKRVEYRTQRIV